MKAELLAKCSKEQLQALFLGYAGICKVYEDVFDGPSKAAINKEYLIARQNCRKVYNLLTELAD